MLSRKSELVTFPVSPGEHLALEEGRESKGLVTIIDVIRAAIIPLPADANRISPGRALNLHAPL